MPKYTAWLPAFCQVKVTLEVDEPLEGQALRDALLDEGEPHNSVCHYCSDHLEPGEVDWDTVAVLPPGDLTIEEQA